MDKTRSIDRRERYHDEEENLRVSFEGMQSDLWTAIPCIVTKVNFSQMTVEAQPAIQALQRFPTGEQKFVSLPLLLDCPIVFPSGGGYTLTMPVAVGDEGLVVFASRCIDSWWQSGGIQQQAELRMHDLSDGFFLPGVFSQPRVIGSISTSKAQLRSNDGETFVEVDGSGQVVKVKAKNGITLDTDAVTVTGIITVQNVNGASVPCNINGDVVASGKSLVHHVHSGVQAGASNTGQPV